MAKCIVINMEDGTGILVRSILETSSEDSLTDHELAINFLYQKIKNLNTSCSCDNGMIPCPGCKDADERDKIKHICAGCKGRGVVVCGKCGGNISINRKQLSKIIREVISKYTNGYETITQEESEEWSNEFFNK